MVPVTTVPRPLTWKTRSTGRRKTPWGERAGNAASVVSRKARSSGTPRPESESTRKSGAIGEKGALHGGANLLVHQFEPVGFDGVGLGERNEALAYAEQAKDLEMLRRFAA